MVDGVRAMSEFESIPPNFSSREVFSFFDLRGIPEFEMARKS
jgi:hypothetical protein